MNSDDLRCRARACGEEANMAFGGMRPNMASLESMSDAVDFVCSAEDWARTTFGTAQLGDRRRTERLVEMAAELSARPGASLAKVCAGDGSKQEAYYRFVRNDKIEPDAITESGCQEAIKIAKEKKLVLLVQDSTDLCYKHLSVRDKLGTVGRRSSKVSRGLIMHTTLAVDGIHGIPIGIADQVRWSRDTDRPSKKDRKTRDYESKESFKWEAACRRIQSRMDSWTNTIVVGDREADIYDLLWFCNDTEMRFVFRGAQNRLLCDSKEKLFDRLASQPVLGQRSVRVLQRGAQERVNGQHEREARVAETVQVEYRSCRVSIRVPRNSKSSLPDKQEVGVVLVSQVGCDPKSSKAGFHWLLLTSEPVESAEEAARIVEIYETRWVIEEYHKVLKSGCNVEKVRMQDVDHLERIAAILAFVAVRLTQLAILSRQQPDAPAECVLEPDTILCLKHSLGPKVKCKNKDGTVAWALEAIARLAGWTDTKRIGHPGWQTLYQGWVLLNERVEGFRAALALWNGQEM